MKKLSVLFLLMYAALANAESVQSYCDTEASNALKMYGDLTSNEFRSGQVTYQMLANNYARQTSAFTSNLNVQILETIYKQKDQITAQDVNDWIYKRCESDYYNYQNWWRANRY